jgi:hypothetical protein
MVRSPFSIHQHCFQTAAVAVASPASAFFQVGDLSECGQFKLPACRRVKLDCNAFLFHVGLKFMVKSFRRLDDGENGGFESSRKFFPSRDYLGQFRT